MIIKVAVETQSHSVKSITGPIRVPGKPCYSISEASSLIEQAMAVNDANELFMHQFLYDELQASPFNHSSRSTRSFTAQEIVLIELKSELSLLRKSILIQFIN